MKRPLVIVSLVLGLVVGVLMVPPAQGLSWTQTSEADFLAGTRSRLDVLPSGDLILASANASWTREGVVVDLFTGGIADSVYARTPSVIWDGTMYKMWYSGFDGGRNRILYATSTNGVAWTGFGVVLDVLQPPWNFDSLVAPSVRKEGSIYKMWFSGGFWTTPLSGNIYYAESTDGIVWSILGMALGVGGAGTWDAQQINYASVTRDPGGYYWLYYTGWDGTPGGLPLRIGLATSSDGNTFTRVGVDPILPLGPTGSWDDSWLQGAFVLPGNPWKLWYAGGDGTANRIGSAWATGPYNWTRSEGNPEFVTGPTGAWDDASVSWISVLVDGPNTYLYYTGLDGTNARIGRARLTPGYVAAGYFESRVLDTGSRGSAWATINSNMATNPFSNVTVRTRTGDSGAPDAAWSPWSAPVFRGTYPITSPRARYIQVRVVMFSGSPAFTPYFNDFTISYELNTAITPVAMSPTGGAWVTSSSLRLEWTYSDFEGDPPRGFQVHVSDRSDFASIAVDSRDVIAPDSFWQTPAIPDGAWYWRVTTMDAFDEWSPYSAAAWVRVDSVPPRTTQTFVSPAGGIGGLPQIDSLNRIVLTATDAGSGVGATMYSVNSGPSIAYTGPFFPAAHGVFTLRYWSVDDAGNAETPALLMLIADDPPAVSPLAPADQSWTRNPAIRLTWGYSDPDGDAPSAYEARMSTDPSFATVDYSSGTVFAQGASHTFGSVPDGTYHWRVRSADAFGLWSPFTSTRTVSLDTVGPSVVADWGADFGIVEGRTWVAEGTDVNLLATDPASGIARIRFDLDSVTADYTGPIRLGGHGPHTVAYWAEDVVGNLGPVGTLYFLIDLAPVATNLNPSDQAWAVAPPPLVWASVDPDGDASVGYEVQVASDAGFTSVVATSGAVSSPLETWRAPGLSDGRYYWRVRVRDEYGVGSAWSAGTGFGVDGSPPEVVARYGSVGMNPGVLVLHPGDSIELTATDALSGVARIEYSLNGGAWTTYSSPVRFDTIGRHVLAFRATDNAGNTEATQVIVVDAVPPFNWTPVLALVFTAVIAALGVLLARRRRETGFALTWAILAGPAAIVEVVLAAYSLVTGELSIPPWTGAGLVSVVGVAAGGFVSVFIGSKALSARGGPPA